MTKHVSGVNRLAAGWCLMILLMVSHPCAAQLKDEPVAGAIPLWNGMIFRGMCSPTSTFDDSLPQRLELRLIDQGYRQIYVSNRRSEPPVVNPNDWPNQTFMIPVQRTGARPVPDVIGAAQSTPFDEFGHSRITLRMPGNQVEDIEVGVSRINELFAEVRGITHDWTFNVPLSTFPMGTMYPGFLKHVNEFDTNPFRRLELARILMKADRPVEAAALLDQSYQDFPELKQQEAELTQGLRTQLAQQALNQIELRYQAGQFEFVRHAARVFPQENLTPIVLVRIRELGDKTEEFSRRAARIVARLAELQGRIADEEQRRQATEMVTALKTELNPHLLDQLAGFELLADGQNRSPESDVALAITGWLLGAEDAISSPTDAWNLFRTRERILDFLRSREEEKAFRDIQLSDIRKTEGVSVGRLAALIRHLPPATPVPLSGDAVTDGAWFELPAETGLDGCKGMVPPEYSAARPYPLLVAFPPESLTATAAIDFWSNLAKLHGCIVVVPELYDRNTVSYAASADQHRGFLRLMTRLKHSLRIDDARVFIAGHGMGGEAAIDLATSHPELFAGVISIASPGRKLFQWTAHNDVALPWYLVMGDRQHQWLARSGLLLSRLFRLSDQRAFCAAIFVKYPGRGFESYFEELPTIFDWMSRCRRRTWPQRIEATTTRSVETDWTWLQLHDISERFVSMDQPSRWDQTPSGPGTISARFTDNNGVILRTLPGGASLRLNPGIPGYDVQKPLTVVAGRKRFSVDYNPDIADLLNDYRLTGDRERLCFMRVDVN